MGECNTILSAYKMYRHLKNCCTHLWIWYAKKNTHIQRKIPEQFSRCSCSGLVAFSVKILGQKNEYDCFKNTFNVTCPSGIGSPSVRWFTFCALTSFTKAISFTITSWDCEVKD